jgi:hypothetical protein
MYVCKGWRERAFPADTLYQLTAPSHGTVKFLSRKGSPWRSVSIANMQLTVWHLCIAVNRKPRLQLGRQKLHR